MLGKETQTIISAAPTFTQNVDESFPIAISGNKAPTKLTLNGNEIPFTPSPTGITVTAGGIYVLIGSYGFLLRGGEFRTVQMTSDGTITETERNLGLNYPNTAFNGKNTLLYLRVEIVDNRPVLTINVENDADMKAFSYTYNTRISGEIPTDDAKVTFAINISAVTSLTVYSTNAWNK